MKIFLTQDTDVFRNIALEEALLRFEDCDEEDLLFISQNKNAVIVGRNQNVYDVVNHDFVEKHGVHVTRRISGGGVVYQDLGNVCFSFISKKKTRSTVQFFILPLIEFLHSIGLDTKIVQPNNIEVDGLKISSIFQFEFEDKIINHGTILFNSDLTMLPRALTNEAKITLSTGITKKGDPKTVNVKDLLKDSSWTTKTFIIQLVNFFHAKGHKSFMPSENTLNQAKMIWQRVSSWEWNYGPFPRYQLKNSYVSGGIKFGVAINLNDTIDKIKDIIFIGNFLSRQDTEIVAKALIEKKFTRNSISKIIAKFNNKDYFGGISKSVIIDTIMGAK